MYNMIIVYKKSKLNCNVDVLLRVDILFVQQFVVVVEYIFDEGDFELDVDFDSFFEDVMIEEEQVFFLQECDKFVNVELVRIVSLF